MSDCKLKPTKLFHTIPPKLMKKLYAAVMLVALCIFSFTAYAQQKEVTGKVSDANGEPLAGVTVIVKGKNRGTTTDAQGNYRISASTIMSMTTQEYTYTCIPNVQKSADGSIKRAKGKKGK